MRILITGHRGFIGRHLHIALQAHQPLCIDIADPHQPQDCRTFFRDNNSHFDLVFHCAATVGGRMGIDHNSAFLGANNLQLDGALFEWALRARPGRIVYFSSAAAYPVKYQNGQYARGCLRMKEGFVNDHLVSPPDESYGLAKWMGEQIASRVRAAGVPVTVVRPFSSYGWDQEETEYPFPAMVRRAARQESPFVVWGDGGQVRDWIAVDDLVAAILALVDARVDGPVNIGTGVGTSMNELAHMCMRGMGYVAGIQHLTDKPEGVRYRVADNSLMCKYYIPTVSIEQGVTEALAALVAT